MFHVRRILIAAIFALLASLPARLAAQASFAAQLRGTVQDASGAVVPAASLIITNDATGVEAKVASDGSGRYIFNNLQPAAYTVTAEAKGFSKLVQSGIVLRVSQQSVLDLTLRVGAATAKRGSHLERHPAQFRQCRARTGNHRPLRHRNSTQ